MRVAVLTLTRDRLWATRHCLPLLRERAGCDFDHLVLDQGSQDGTVDWLKNEYRPKAVVELGHNVGISRGINILLDLVATHDPYDVIVKVDNDLELLVDGTLRVAAELVKAVPSWILSPHIKGLNQPPGIDHETVVCGRRVGVPATLGGIFMAAPARLYENGYRHDPGNPVWGMDDARLVDHWRAVERGEVGYLLDYPAMHHLTTDGQARRDPAWFERKKQEFAAA